MSASPAGAILVESASDPACRRPVPRGRRAGAVFCAALAASSCGAESVGPATVLTELELQTAFSAIFNSGVVEPFVTSPLFSSGAAVPGVAVPIESDIDETVACSAGGSFERLIRSQGTLDDQTQEADVDFEVTLVHDSCVDGASNSSVRVDLSGAPLVQTGFRVFRSAAGELVIEGGAVQGTVRIITDAANVICSANVGFSAVGGESSTTYSFVGRFCDIGVQGTFTGAF